MTKRLPLILACALASSACAGGNGNNPTGPGKPVTMEQKIKRVEALTRALSLTQNEAMKKAADGLGSVGTTMSSGAFSKTASAVSSMASGSGGNVVAAGAGNYVLQALVEDLHRGVWEDSYALLATQKSGDATIEYDDATGELKGIKSDTGEATFKFDNRGKTRTWTVSLLKTPDGTTGTMTFEISADTWKAMPSAALRPDPPPTPEEPAEPDEPDVEPGDPEEDGGEEEPADQYALSQADAQIKIFGGEAPDFNTLTRAKLKLDIKPQGNDKGRVKLEVVVDDFKPFQKSQLPSRLGLDFSVPGLSFDSDTTVKFTATEFTGGSSKGGLKVKTAEADESFKYAINGSVAGTGDASLTNEGAKIRYTMKVTKGSRGEPVVNQGLYDVDGGAKIADLEPSQTEPNTIVIKFTNGQTVKWDVAGGRMIGVPVATGTVTPVAKKPVVKATPRPRATPRPTAGASQ